MSRHDVRGDVPEEQPHTLHHACGAREIPSLVEQLAGPDDIVRSKAAIDLADLVHRPEHALAAVHAGSLPVLAAALEPRAGNGPDLRARAAEALAAMALHRAARQPMRSAVQALVQALDDRSPAVRSHALAALERLADDAQCRVEAADQRLVQTLVARIATAPFAEMPAVLDTLSALCRAELSFARQAVGAGIVCSLVDLFGDVHETHAARLMLALAALPEGRHAVVVHAKTATVLVAALSKLPPTELTTCAAGIAAFAAVDVAGKGALVNAGAVDALVALLSACSGSEPHLLPVLQCIAATAEHPKARAALLQEECKACAALERIAHSSPAAADAEIAAAERALAVIKWKP